MTGTIETVRGPIAPEQLGATLMHEHILIRNQEFEANMALPEFDMDRNVELAVAGLRALQQRGITSMVDLTVIGLGRDIHPIIRINEQVPDFNIVAATGYYTFKDLPSFFHNHGPGRMIEGPDPLHQMFVRDITEGIPGTKVKAADHQGRHRRTRLHPGRAARLGTSRPRPQRHRRPDHHPLQRRAARRPRTTGSPQEERRHPSSAP